MKKFNLFVAGLWPANRNLQFIDVKEMSERMEMAEARAEEAIKIALACRKQYVRGYKLYLAQIKKRSKAA